MRDFRSLVLEHLPPLDVSGGEEAGIVEELAQELEDRYDRLIRDGVDPAHAWPDLEARIDWRALATQVEAARGLGQAPTNSSSPISRLFARARTLAGAPRRDLRSARRMVQAEPGFVAAAVISLALCLGASLAIFAVVDAILLRALPFPEPERLVTLYNTYPGAGVDRAGSSVTSYYERRGKIAALDRLALYRAGTATVGDADSARREDVLLVTPDFFTTLGVGPVLGRAFNDDEMSSETDDVVILTDAFWREHFSADPNAVGRRMQVNGVAASVVGVLPPGFRFLSSRARLYLPLASGPFERAAGRRHWLGSQMVGRLREDATIADAQAQIDAHNAAVEESSPAEGGGPEAGFRTIVAPLHEDHVEAVRQTLVLLQAGAVLLVVIACVNLINLLLVRASRRARDWAVRRVFGAGLRHAVHQALVESLFLSVAGGSLGVLVGAGGARLFTALGVDRLPLGGSVVFGGRVVWTAILGMLAVGLVLAVPIAWFNLRGHPADALRSESRAATAGPGVRRLRHAFVVGQIALAFVLLCGAFLLGTSLRRTLAVSPGFGADHLLTARMSLPGTICGDSGARVEVTDRMLAEVERLPGVEAVGLTTNLPFSGNVDKLVFSIDGRAAKPGEAVRGHYHYGVSGDALKALGLTLLEGRFLTSDDSIRGDQVCVVDGDFARRYWPGGGALGQRLFQGATPGTDAEAFEIVGVVGAVKQAGLTEPAGQGAVYLPYRFRAQDEVQLVIRTDRQPRTVASAVRRAVRAIDPGVPVTDLRSMDDRIADSLVGRQAPAILTAIFAVVAVLLAAVGTFGVLSAMVTQNRREIGIRMALGAAPSRVLNEFMGLGAKLLAGGLVLGVPGAWAAGHSIRSLLFGIGSGNVGVLIATAGMMSGFVMLAILLPSHRASQLAITDALRDE